MTLFIDHYRELGNGKCRSRQGKNNQFFKLENVSIFKVIDILLTKYIKTLNSFVNFLECNSSI